MILSKVLFIVSHFDKYLSHVNWKFYENIHTNYNNINNNNKTTQTSVSFFELHKWPQILAIQGIYNWLSLMHIFNDTSGTGFKKHLQICVWNNFNDSG